ncbi:hypothetical protein BX600DRAFT_385275 [Xylariales sp. PMI_506]|nr:hypothetical protein BX600DRAFT_385275 [Xylariales sp. PMI_506]
MSTKVTRALVVGGTSGVGYSIACRIAATAKASTVIISGRSEPKSLPHANMEFRKLDASSMRSIKAYTDAYKAAQEPKLDLLVLTQGIMTIGGRAETPEGIDRKMALHHYGRHLLIRELGPALADDAKVLVVLDSLIGDPNKLNWDDLDLKTTFSTRGAADHCTAMNDAMIQEHAAETGGSTHRRRHFVHAYPGIVKTGLWRTLPVYMQAPAWALTQVIAVSSDKCAENLIKGTYESAAAEEADGKFWSYIDDKGRLVKKAKTPWTEEQRQKVADHTWKIIDDAIAAGK